ncbi:MAG TPA: 3-hydroxyacyl-CoA dehydrogenase NAD-binding domain-containing protein [Candidatus Limnocylindrales bacterium]|nr:3-hydroxyacyl-CoA dehydrogenase NAD-binding domain-containing protein [Candidatus Limnocylindrales bacterium]
MTEADSASAIGAIGAVGVIGAGTMGAGIAQLALEAGHEVRIHDVDAAAIERGRARIRTGLERRAARLDLDPESADAWVDGRLVRLTDAPTLAEVASVGPGLVIEAALEDLELKRTIFHELDALVPARTILATNTSALSVTAIAAAAMGRGRVVGLHFFNPAPVMPLVEVIAASATDPAVVDRSMALMTHWGKVAVRSADTPGFIVNRVNRPFTLEALAMLEAGGTSIETIDATVRADGFPLGPFELMDLTGIDISLAAALAIFERSRAADDPLSERFRPSPVQERLVAEGRLGRKTGRGFYRYDDAGRRLGPAPEFAPADASPDDGADPRTVERIVLAIVNEAYRAAGDGVATPADIDLALRLGASHPSGPFERAAELGGPGAVLAALSALAPAGPRFDPAPSLRSAG